MKKYSKFNNFYLAKLTSTWLLIIAIITLMSLTIYVWLKTSETIEKQKALYFEPYLSEDIPFAVLIIGLVALSFGVLFYLISRLYASSSRSLEDSRNMLNNIIDNAVDGIITINEYGVVSSYNKACEKIFGYKEGEVIGNNINMLMPSPYRQEHDSYLKNYRQTGKKKIIGIGREVAGKRKDGSVFPVDLSVSEISLSGKRFFSGIVRDITERKEAEQERERLIEQLTDSNEDLQRFAYVCSHDLQEPLRMIRSFSEKFESHFSHIVEKDEKGKKYMGFILDGAKRAQNLIYGILSYSRIDKETQKTETIDMNEQLEAVKDNLFTNLEEIGGKITSEDLPEIKGNRTQIYQLLQNLINNGLKYQNQGVKPHIHLGYEDLGSHWEFHVKDNGIGIAEKHLKRIFEVFKRLHNKDEYQGTGIGLSICKKIVERHGGKIAVESEPGEGSTFRFTISKSNFINQKKENNNE